MQTRILSIVLVTAIPLVGTGCSKQVSFQEDVQPIMTSSCVMCHDSGGEGLEKSGFGVQSYDSIMEGTKFGPLVVPGDSASSSLYLVVAHKTDTSIHMPPHHETSVAEGEGAALTPAQIETIKLWIDQGAKNN